MFSDENIEPIAFTFGVISSAFLSLPSIAEYFYPERKPVSIMTFDEIIDFIPKTDFKEDWTGITRNWSSERFLKEDPRLRVRSKYTDDGIQNDNFLDPWANNHPNPKAVGYWIEVYYDGAFLDRVILVSVDGGRAMIPTPVGTTNKIHYYDYAIASIMDVKENVDEYISRSKLYVEKIN